MLGLEDGKVGTADEVDATPERPSEAERVRAWRVERFRELGFTFDGLAERLAETRGADGFPLDWHAVARLVAAGCDRIAAVEILS